MRDRSPFLTHALEWIYPQGPPQCCDVCGFDWGTGYDAALRLIEDAVPRYIDLLQGRDGMAPAADGGWNATSYLWHLTDLARSWSERWVQVAAEPGSTLVGWDPDELAATRGYRSLPTAAAVWALRNAATTFVELSRATDPQLQFTHGDWGVGYVFEGARWIAHEYVHHLLDVAERATDPS